MSEMPTSGEATLRAYLGRILGWSRERTQAVEHALRSIHLSISHCTTLVLLGDTDPVPIARALHCHTLGADRPFVVCDPRRLSNMAPATVRAPTSYKRGAAAVRAAQGGSLCVRRRRLPHDIASSAALARDPSVNVQIIVCGAVHAASDRFVALLVPILVPALTTRASEVPRIVDEYAADAIGTLGADESCFTDLDRKWTFDHAAGSLAEIEKATLRLVALKMTGSITQAAKARDVSRGAVAVVRPPRALDTAGQGGRVNDQARALVADVRALLHRHPRARAIDAHAGTWLQVYITAVDDAAVDTFAAELGLGPPAYASHEGVSWYRAALSEIDAAITVIGPPPQGASLTRGSEVGRGWRRAVKAPPFWYRPASSEPPLSAIDLVARLSALSGVLARRRPAVLAAMITQLEAVLSAAQLDLAAGRAPMAPVALTAEQVLEAARARGVPAFAGGAGDRRILLASLGLDLNDSGIRAALVEMHRRGELHLAPLDDVGAARADLAARGLRVDLVEESAVGDGATLFHMVVIS